MFDADHTWAPRPSSKQPSGMIAANDSSGEAGDVWNRVTGRRLVGHYEQRSGAGAKFRRVDSDDRV